MSWPVLKCRSVAGFDVPGDKLNGMVILEDESKTRFLVRAKDIKMIVVPSDGKPDSQIESEPQD